jgi:hypothetical protein
MKAQLLAKREDLMKLQRLGGYASIVQVCLNIVMVATANKRHIGGFTGLGDIYNPAKMMPAYQAAPVAFWAYYVMGILTAILTLLIVLALEERMKADAPHLMRLAVISVSAYAALTITAMIGGFFRNALLAGTNDMSAFRAFLVLHELLGNAAISAGGWGFLLIGWTALRTRALPRILSYAMLAFGIMSIVLFAFTVSQVQLGLIVFLLLFLIVFVWLGVVLLRKPELSIA